MQAVSDEQLIEWVAAGDASCLGTLFERHHRDVYQFCQHMLRNEAAADDVVQDVFLKLLKSARSFRRDGSFRAWLFNIARNAVMDHYRRNRSRAELQTGADQKHPEPVDSRSAEQSAAAHQNAGFVVEALRRLPGNVQEVIWLGRFVFDNYEELGAALGCKTATARVRMHRAIGQLNAEFELLNGAPIDV